MPGGRREGAGRRKGSPNKRTVQKIIEASQNIAEIKRKGQKKATEVLNELMQTAVGFAAQQQQAIMTAGDKATKEQVEMFRVWLETAGSFAKALAPFQDPTFKAIQVIPSAMPIIPGDGAKPINGKVVKMDDPAEVVRLYQLTMKRIA